MHATSILRVFNEHGVEYLVTGASAVWLHGVETAAAPSLDVCFRQEWSNCECLIRALEEIRAAVIPPRRVPIPLTADLRSGREPLRFETPAGPLSLVPAIPGLGGYDELSAEATEVAWDDETIPVMSLRQLRCWAATHPACAAPFLDRLLALEDPEPDDEEDSEAEKRHRTNS